MFISKMNKLFHKHGRVAFAILTLLIIVPFILYFSVAPDEILSSFSSFMNKSNVSICGKRMSKTELNKGINSAMATMILQGWPPDFLNSSDGSKQVLTFAIERVVLGKEAVAIGIKIDDKAVADSIKIAPLFQEQGKFSYDRYKMFLYIMGRYGLSEAEVTESVRETLAIDALRNQISESVLVTNTGMEEFYNSINLDFSIRIALFNAKDYLNKVIVNDQKLKAYFEANKSNYIIPKKSKASIVEFCFSNYRAGSEKEITENMINEYYLNNKKVYADIKQQEAKAKIKAQLIDESCSNKAKMDAQNFAVNVFKAIGQNGKAIAVSDVFKNYTRKTNCHFYNISQWFTSDDQNVASLGKQPGLISSISELFLDQPISNAIRGDKSYFVACLTDREEARGASLSEVRERVVQDFKYSQALLMAKNAAVEARFTVIKSLKSTKNLSELMSANGFANAIKFNGSDYKTIAEMKNGEGILALSMKTKQGEISSVTDNRDGAMMVYVEKISTPFKDAFDKAKSQIEAQYKQYLQQLAWENYRLMLKNKAGIMVYGENSTSYTK